MYIADVYTMNAMNKRKRVEIYLKLWTGKC